MFIITLSDVIILVIIAAALVVLGILYLRAKRSGKPKKIKCVEVKPTAEERAEMERQRIAERLEKLEASDPAEYQKVKRRLAIAKLAAGLFVAGLCYLAYILFRQK